jgi:aryl-alcohol dehydrogenase-like predicted oxidoreductase
MAHGVFEPRRELGRTGFVATRLGIGDLADRSVPIEQCVATARRAIDAGLNVIDTAPGYEDGTSERIVGRAVVGVRDQVFVIDKIDHPTEPVAPQVEGSLDRLRLDNVDLFLFHGVSDMATWQALAAPGGGMEQLAACVRAGQCRFRGISSHHPDVLAAALASGLCDVLMFAIGPYCHPRYATEILPEARRRGVGTVCFKTFGAGKLLQDTEGYSRPLSQRPRGKVSSGGVPAPSQSVLPRLTVDECLRYTLTRDPDVALLGLSFPNEQDQAFAAVAAFAPFTDAELDALEARALEAVRHKGRCWWNPPDWQPHEVPRGR